MMSETESRLADAESRFQDLSNRGAPYTYKKTTTYTTSSPAPPTTSLPKDGSKDGDETVMKYKDDGLVESGGTGHIKPFQAKPLGK